MSKTLLGWRAARKRGPCAFFLRRGGLEVEEGCCFGKIGLAGGVIWGSGRGLARVPEQLFGRRAEPKREEEGYSERRRAVVCAVVVLVEVHVDAEEAE